MQWGENWDTLNTNNFNKFIKYSFILCQVLGRVFEVIEMEKCKGNIMIVIREMSHTLKNNIHAHSPTNNVVLLNIKGPVG